jgi:hypothetical protein
LSTLDQMNNEDRQEMAQKVVLYVRKGARLNLMRRPRPHLKPPNTRDAYFTI